MGGEDVDKIIRVPGGTLQIKLSPEEETYRQKYLPDPKKLTDEKLVCTVCSVSLSQDIHRGKDIFIHRALQVLVCENCYTFYGDGCFSADEDGDDKYCRWCGQGGTLFLCSACNCAFCQKCTKQNLKSSVLAELDNDDWKCYICNPRPLFGCRTICWGAQQLNKIGKQKEQEKLRKQRERLEKLEARKKEGTERKSRKISSSEDEASIKKRKRHSDSDSSSPEVIPKKRTKRESRSAADNRNLNGSIGRRRRKESSSNSESEKGKRVTRPSRSSSKKGKTVETSSEYESDNKSKKDKVKKKKKKKGSSDESSDEGEKKPKRKSKKKDSSVDESSDDEKSKKKKHLSRKKKDDTSDSLSDEKNKRKLKKKKKGSSSEESSGETKKKSKKHLKKKADQLSSSSEKSSDEEDSHKSKKKTKSKVDKEGKSKKQETGGDSDNELKKGNKVTTDNLEGKANSAEDILIKKRIKLAILWLSSTVKDISELGTLISIRATKFSKRKINAENLKTYDDVLNSVNKIKQLISGVHSNYDHIEKALESHFTPWKRMTGLEETENGKNIDKETSVAVDPDVSKSSDISVVESLENKTDDSHDKLHKEQVNGTNEETEGDKAEVENEVNLNWSDESDDDQNETRALISKANETLDKSQDEDLQSESNEKNETVHDLNKAESDSKKGHESNHEESAEEKDDKENEQQSRSTKNESEKSVPGNQLLKKSDPESKKDVKENSEKSSEPTEIIEESDSENEDKVSPKKSTPVKKNVQEDKIEIESEHEEADIKEEMELEGNNENDALQNDFILGDTQFGSSEEDTALKYFRKRLEDKWKTGKQTEEMNLKQPVGIDSSGESDGEIDQANNAEQGKKTKKEHKVPKILIKKVKLEEGGECNEFETTSSSSKEAESIKTSIKDHENVMSKNEKEDSIVQDSEGEGMETKEKENLKSSRKQKISDKPKTVNNEDEEEKEKDTKTKRKRDQIKVKKDLKESKSRHLDEDSEIEDTETSRKVSQTIKKKKTKEYNARCLSSEEEIKEENIETKRKVVKTKNKRQVKGDKSKALGIEDSDDEDFDDPKTKKKIKNTNKGKKHDKKEKLKSQSSDSERDDDKDPKTKRNIKKKRKNDQSKSLSDDEEENQKTKGKTKDKRKAEDDSHCITSEEESINVEDEKNKSKDKDFKRKKFMEEENCVGDDIKSELEENKSKSKAERKNKLEDIHSDEEKDNNVLLKENKSGDENSETSKIDEKEEIDDKDESPKKTEKITVVSISSSDEQDDTRVTENGEKRDMNEENSDEKSSDACQKKKSPKKRSERNQRRFRASLVLSSDEEDEGEKQSNSRNEENDDKDESFSPTAVSDAESMDSDILPKNKRKKKSDSDSDFMSVSDEDKKKKKKRRRIRCANSSDESGNSGDEKLDISQKSNQGESPGKGGRKNIKKIKKKDDLEEATIEAAEEEKERRRRIEERQKLFNQVFEIKESAKLEKLVLDFDPESKKELISVNSDLVSKMKPHQAKGVKFMWDSCFESVKQVKKNKGSGCILAHCMGLGKTFQVISLVHTLLIHEELTKVRSVMVVCPLSTVLNWYNEFDKWLDGVEGGDDIEVFHLTKYNKNPDRARELRRWQHNGGVLIIGYEMFRNLTNESNKKFKVKLKRDFQETLIDPGADLIICDEGHMLKNEATALSKAMSKVKTARRIVLTGTPMQNNLKEYHCMVQFVKPNLLGTSKEFLNRFVNPINNGQFVDSTEHDVKLMKRRAHVLHKMLEGLVQRFDYNVLTPFLPPKQEYVISVCLSELQEKLYSYYLENCSQKSEGTKGGTRLFQDWQSLGRIWTHPRVLKMSTDKANWLKEKKALEESDSEGSLKDFIDDGSEEETTTPEESEESSGDDDKKKKNTVKSRSTRSTRQNAKNVALLESSEDEKNENDLEEALEDTSNKGEWWSEFIELQHFEDMRQSGKLILLFAILKECELIEDKILVFSQSLFSLDMIEYFLDKIDAATQEGRLDENLGNHQGTWSKGLDYFRLDGSTSSENRNIWCKAFNREDNPRARLFLISTRAGGLGINLTAANRVIIFDASWNPSHDIQSIFRIYRFGQKKPCYVYRFVAFGTMEEKVYERQVAKQSISNRVVDEQQVHRHFTMSDLNELYTFSPASKLEERPTFALPRDPLMAEILSQMKQWIEKYHEHDSLLENVVEEELNEEERKAAWEDYENDKKRGFMPAVGPQGPSMNPNASWNTQIEYMRQQLKLKYPAKSDDEINQILVYQVSLLMKQQQQQQLQMAAQMQAASNMGYQSQMMGGQMFNARQQFQTTPFLRNIAPKPQTTAAQQQDFNAQVYRMQQQANLARLQMQQQQYQQQQKAQQKSVLAAQLGQSTQPPYRWQQPSTPYPTGNMSAAFNNLRAAELLQMKQNYQASRQSKPPGVKITEITEDDTASKSNES